MRSGYSWYEKKRESVLVRDVDGVWEKRGDHDGKLLGRRTDLADFGNEQRAHARAGPAAERVRDLEALQAVAALGLLADDVEDRVDELGALGVVALGPVVAGAGLAEDEVVRAEKLAEGAGADRVHGAGLEVHEDGARHVAAAGRLVVVDVDALSGSKRESRERAR